MNLKTKIASFLLVLTLTLLLAACGENASAGNPSTGTQTAAAAAVPTTAASATNPTTGNSQGGSENSAAKVDPCRLFSQSDGETALGVKLEKKPSKDNSAFTTCFYSTYDDGQLQIRDTSLLSVQVYTGEATPAWYASVKREYQEQTPDKVLNPVEGVGTDGFSFTTTDHFTDGKTVNMGVLKDKTFFMLSVINAHLEEGVQAANLKELARKIAGELN